MVKAKISEAADMGDISRTSNAAWMLSPMHI